MKVYKTTELENHLFEKGISKLSNDSYFFNKNDYFQVINAYKSLFVVGVENLSQIYNNIDSQNEIPRYKKAFSISDYTDNDDLKTQIFSKICKKYEGSNIISTKDLSEKINYIHHIYDSKCTDNDFLRIYEFEHEMRCLLLKYTLIIESNLKRVFIKTLNDTPNMEDSYITNIGNYTRCVRTHTGLIRTLKNILDLHNSSYSKPIVRKVNQDIIVPYWILINEMSFGVVINCIKNLKTEISNAVYENLIKEFSNASFSFSSSRSDDISHFKKILDYIATFRNILAHNQPIFAYNIKDESLCSYPKCEYNQPQVSKDNIHRVKTRKKISLKDAKLRCQQIKNNKLKETCKKLFGKDSFNQDKNPSNMNLSYMLYFIYKINLILDKNCEMKKELSFLFYKYNILDHSDRYTINNFNGINNLIKQIKDFSKSTNYIPLVNNNKSNEKIIDEKKISGINSFLEEINSKAISITKDLIPRKYDAEFQFDLSYEKKTGISLNFLKKL